MIAWNDGTWTLNLFTHKLSPEITDMAINIIENYTSLNYYAWPPADDVGGDIQPFLDAGYHGIYFMEPPINPYYHTVNDLMEYCDFPYLAEATKVSLGCILHADLTVGENEKKPISQELTVYPNPAGEEITIWLNSYNSSYRELKIFNMNGEELYTAQCLPGNNRLDVSFLPDGFYLMFFNNGKEIHCEKLIIKR